MQDDRRKYRKIFIRLWRNKVFRQLADGEKVLTLYLLSGPQTNRVGLFPFSLGQASDDLATAPAALRKRFQRVCEAFAWRFDADAGVIWIPSWWAFNTPKGNIQNFQGALSDLGDVPASPLLSAFSANTDDIPEEFRALIQKVAVPRQCSTSAVTQETRQDKQEKETRHTGPDRTPATALQAVGTPSERTQLRRPPVAAEKAPTVHPPATSATRTPSATAEKAPVAQNPARDFLTWFQAEYATRRHGAQYFVSWAKHMPIVGRLLKLHHPQRLRKHAQILLTTDEEWIETTDRGIEVLAGKINWLEERLTAWEVKQGMRHAP